MTDKENPQQQARPQQVGSGRPAGASDQQQQQPQQDVSPPQQKAPAPAVLPPSPPVDSISVTVAPFTGGPFSLSVSRRDSVEELKKAVAKRLKVLKDRICLLYRER